MAHKQEVVRLAVNEVLNENLSLRKAALKYNIPRTSLQRYVKKNAQKNLIKSPIASSPHEALVPELSDPEFQLKLSDFLFDKDEEESVSKGPYKALNYKIRAMSKSVGSAIDELSNELISKGRKVFKLGLGQSPFPIPQCIVDELRSNAHQRDYLPVAGLKELREDIARWGTATYGLSYTFEDVLVGPGTKELLFVLQTVYYGDLLLPNPSCTSYAPQASIAGRNMFHLPTHANDRWLLRPEVLENQCSNDPDAPRILILNYPSNPTGCAYHADELEAIANIARKYRILVISDEIYSDLHHNGQHISISYFYPEGTIISGGLSKWCGAGGWRVGFWLFPSSLKWLKQGMLVMASETYTSVASPIQYAARRAFRLNCPILNSYKKGCQKVLRLVGKWCADQLSKSNIEVNSPEGGFYIFPCFQNYKLSLHKRGIDTDLKLCEELLKNTGVAILPGSFFGQPSGELTARVAYVDFEGLYAIHSTENSDNLDAYMEVVCPNIVDAIKKMCAWVTNES